MRKLTGIFACLFLVLIFAAASAGTETDETSVKYFFPMNLEEGMELDQNGMGLVIHTNCTELYPDDQIEVSWSVYSTAGAIDSMNGTWQIFSNGIWKDKSEVSDFFCKEGKLFFSTLSGEKVRIRLKATDSAGNTIERYSIEMPILVPIYLQESDSLEIEVGQTERIVVPYQSYGTVSSDPSIFTARDKRYSYISNAFRPGEQYTHIEITGVSAGSATLSLTDRDGVIHPTTVTVKENNTASDENGLFLKDGQWVLLQNGKIRTEYSGLYEDPDQGWLLIRNGIMAAAFTGLWNDPNCGWWFIRNGAIDWDYEGLWNDPNCGWWLIQNGTIAWDYTGNYNDPNCGIWYISDGTLAGPAQAERIPDGLKYDADGIWRLYLDGAFASGYTGLYFDLNYGWWLIAEGRLCSEYTGLWNDPNYGWWLIAEGRLCSEYTGLWNAPNNSWWLIADGRLCTEYTGLWNDPNCGWWLIGGGGVISDYNGLWEDPNLGWWLINNGTINFDYTGPYDEFGVTLNIVNGQLVF